MSEVKDDKYLNHLENTLSLFFPQSVYSINVYREDAICIEKDGEKWCVYYGMKNTKDQPELFSDITRACERVIYRLSSSMDMYELIKDTFFSGAK